jgi:hypothetical protein
MVVKLYDASFIMAMSGNVWIDMMMQRTDAILQVWTMSATKIHL